MTGAIGGIGRAVTDAFNESGWFVIGFDQIGTERERLTELLQVDVRDRLAVMKAAEEVVGRYGRVDAVINNAAVQVNKSLLLTSDEEWQDTLRTNVSGAFYCSQAFHAALRGSSGAIVNVSSIHALATSPNVGAYAVSKGALVSLTRATALEFASDGIRCNAVLLGAVDTPMLRKGLGRRPQPEEGSAETALARRTPLGRLASPEEVAPTILYLADGERSAYTTGAAVVVDGGATLRLATE